MKKHSDRVEFIHQKFVLPNAKETVKFIIKKIQMGKIEDILEKNCDDGTDESNSKFKVLELVLVFVFVVVLVFMMVVVLVLV